MTKTASHRFTRRALMLTGAAGILATACSSPTTGAASADSASAAYSDSDWRNLTEADWRDRLSSEAFGVLRKEDTERAFTSPLEGEKREGVYHCAGCDLALFSSETKFDSGTGWPSFSDVLDGAVGTKSDNKLWMERTEYHCARCLGHQGHVFNDGPAPTGLRYCNNGVALTFKPSAA